MTAPVKESPAMDAIPETTSDTFIQVCEVWVPENEFGNWDGVRLRRGRDRFAIRVPDEARALDAQP